MRQWYWQRQFKMNEVTWLLIINVIVVISLFHLFDSLQSMGPNSLMFIRNLLDKLGSNQQNILKFIACNEIFLMPATVFMLFRYNLFAWILSCPVAQNIVILNQSERILCCDFLSYNSVLRNTFHSLQVLHSVTSVLWYTNHRDLTSLNLISSISVQLHSFYILLYWIFHTCIFFLQWPRKLSAAFYLLQIPDPALHIQKKSLLPVKF